MDYEREIRSLAGETLALQTLFVSLGIALCRSGNQALVAQAFDAAANFIEDRVIEAGSRVPPEHLSHALAVIEKLRSSTLGGP